MTLIEDYFKFSKYVQHKKQNNYHIQISKMIQNIHNSICKDSIEVPNLILYGSEGSGKYSIALEYIHHFSKSSLQYEKKCNVEVNKEELHFKLSDIHYEIDIDRLGCNQKTSFLNHYNHILEIIKNKKNMNLKQLHSGIINTLSNTPSSIDGILLIKNFHSVSLDLLNIFDNFLENNKSMVKCKSKVRLCFILVTKNISFLSDSILNHCTLISVPKPLLSKMNVKLSKNTLYSQNNLNLLQNDNTICLKKNESFTTMIHYLNSDTLHIEEFRNLIYNVLIYQEDIFEFIYSIIDYVVYTKDVEIDYIIDCVKKFNTYYNNNYRPIFHLEHLFISLYLKIHQKDEL